VPLATPTATGYRLEMTTQPTGVYSVDLETEDKSNLTVTESSDRWWVDVPPFAQLALVVVEP